MTRPVAGVSIHGLHSCKERFQLYFLSCTSPGAQLWFQPHLCMWATHTGLLLRLPWSTQVCPSVEEAQRWHSDQGCRRHSGNRCAGEPEAMGTRVGPGRGPSYCLAAHVRQPAPAVTRHLGEPAVMGMIVMGMTDPAGTLPIAWLWVQERRPWW